MEPKQRILFGKEAKLEILSPVCPVCPGCNAKQGCYTNMGVMSWIIQDVTELDPEAALEMEKHMAGIGFRKSGDGYMVTAEDIAPHINMTIEEAEDVLGKLQVNSSYPEWERYTGIEQ